MRFREIQIQEKLARLRKRWLKEPTHRDTIELQARALKIALKKLKPSVLEKTFKKAKKIFDV